MTKRMILISSNHPHLRFSRKEVLRTAQIVLKEEGRKNLPLAVILTHNRFIRKINKEYLSHNYSTDVIAFPLADEDGTENEVYINLDAAKSQAEKYNVSFTQEARRLLIHGVLHVLGYTDKTARGKNKMTACEDCYLAKLSRIKRK